MQNISVSRTWMGFYHSSF